jgi:hypothetical protein
MEKTIEVFRLPQERAKPFLEPVTLNIAESPEEYIQQAFDELLANDRLLTKWVKQMQRSNLEVVIFGGWVRDRIMEMIYGQHYPSKDVDLVCYGPVSIGSVLPKRAIRNPFGGFRINATSIQVDAWNLQDTFLIRRYRLPVSFQQLPITADYTVNAVVFKPRQFFGYPEVIEQGAIYAIQSGVLDFVANDVAMPIVQVARAVILSIRLNLDLSPTVCSFINVICSSLESKEMVKNGIRTYCPEQLVEKAIGLFNSILNNNIN